MKELGQAKTALTNKLFCFVWQLVDGYGLTGKPGRYTAAMPSTRKRDARPPTPEEILGGRIRELRGRRKIREINELAQLGVPKLSSLERGKAKNPTLGTIIQVARGLKVPLAQLFDIEPSVEMANAETGGRDAQYVNPALQSFVDRFVGEAPTPGSWRADVLDAIATLTRALQRPEDSAAASEGSRKTGR